MKGLALVAILATAPPAWAQPTEIAALAGYSTAGSLDSTAAGIQALEIDDGFTWGLSAGRFFSTHLGAEVSWARQESALVVTTSGGSAELFDMSVSLLHGSLVYQFGGEDARLRPFVFTGLGASFLGATGLDGETKLSWSLGTGLKWFPRRGPGFRLQARYDPTLLHDESSEDCDPFGFCQGTLHQFELMGGVVFRF